NGDLSFNELNGVAVISDDDIWAVGSSCSTDCVNRSDSRTLTLHWDGNNWTRVPSPTLRGGPNDLYAVAAVSANDVWAAGTYYGSIHGYSSTRLIMHWDGTQWSVVTSPVGPQAINTLNSMAALSTNDVWIAGYYSPPG